MVKEEELKARTEAAHKRKLSHQHEATGGYASPSIFESAANPFTLHPPVAVSRRVIFCSFCNRFPKHLAGTSPGTLRKTNVTCWFSIGAGLGSSSPQNTEMLGRKAHG